MGKLFLTNKDKMLTNIYLALCWGENAHVHGKKSFPYPHAALR